MSVETQPSERDWLSRLSLRHFRNYTSAEIEPGSGINLIVGQNAQGKTNLLESIHLMSTGRLLRGHRDAQGVKDSEDEAKIEGRLTPSQSEVEIILRANGRKSIRWNSNVIRRSSDLLGRLPCVSFSATDLSIARGEPADRRLFMDTEIGQVLPNFLKSLETYKKALKQRNAMLRQAREIPLDENLIESYEVQLAESGSRVRKYREDWTNALRDPIDSAMSVVGGGDRLQIAYEPGDEASSASEISELLRASRYPDIKRGSTSIGPHRDDLRLTISELDVRHFGSQGQQRSAVLALKVAVMKNVMSTYGHAPLLLLDDVFSDLDSTRRAGVIELALEAGGQVFITCTDREQAGDGLASQATIFSVRSGEVTQE